MHRSAPRVWSDGSDHHPGGLGIAVILALLLGITADLAAAYPRARFEREPNDTVQEAESFRGQAQLMGDLRAGDVDMFWWGVDDHEADRLWTIELEGETEAAIDALFSWPADESETAVQQFGAAPEAAEATDLLSLNASARRAVTVMDHLIVPPGEHLVSLHPDGGAGSYRLQLSEGASINIRGTVNSADAVDIAVSPGRQWFFQLGVEELAIPLEPDPEADSLWRLSLLGELGAPLEAWIESAAGEVLERRVSGSPLQRQWGRLALAEGATLHVRHTGSGNIGRVGVQLDPDGRKPRDEPQPAAQREAVASSLEDAIWVEAGERFDAELIDRQSTFRAFQIDERQAESGWSLDVTGDFERGLEVCLGEISGRDPVCRQGPAEDLYRAMQLAPGDYFLRLRAARSADAPQPVQLSLRQTASPRDGQAIEPDDEQDWATPLAAGVPVSGHIAGTRSAWFDLVITGSTELWDVDVDGESLSRLAVYRDGTSSPIIDNHRGRRAPDSGALRIHRVALPPGRYKVRVVGEHTQYRVVATPQGPPQPGQELEPNDDEIRATPLRPGVAVRGHFHSPRDEDYYYFYLPGWNRVVLDLQPPRGGELNLDLVSDGERLLRASTDEQGQLRLGGYLPPGDYYLIASGSGDPDAQYRVHVEVEAPWSASEAEPFASSPAFALPVPGDGFIQLAPGVSGLREQYFALAVTSADRTIELLTEQSRLSLISPAGTEHPLESTDTGYRAAVPAGTPLYLQISDREAERPLQVDDPALFGSAEETIELALRLADESVVPFLTQAQRLPAQMAVTNLSEQAQTVRIETHASHSGGRTVDLPDEINLQPYESRELDFFWHLPPELSDEMDVRLFARAHRSTTEARVRVEADAEAVHPLEAPNVPEGLLGMPDLAWAALGAAFIDPESEEIVEERYQGQRFNGNFLIDGMSTGGSALNWTQDVGQPLPPLRLAGDGGTIHGVMFNQRSPYQRAARWREVEISYSDDLVTFTPLMSVELDSEPGPQFFEVEKPVQARYLQLRPSSRWGGGSGAHGTGLFRALGTPQGALADTQHNLMSPALGGHWIYALPAASRVIGFPSGNQAASGSPIRGRTQTVVYGFLQHRAARLSAIDWIEAAEHSGVPVERVRVSTATDSPLGPWRKFGTWELTRDGSGKASFVFDDPVRARYLKLEIVEPERGSGQGSEERRWRFPGAIDVFEADTLGSGQSILGHWGMDDDYGPMEAAARATEENQEAALAETEDSDSHPGAPRRLDRHVVGRVMEPGDARSYRIELAAPDNALDLVLEGSAPGRLRTVLLDPDENEIAVSWVVGDDGERYASVNDLSPGNYRLDVIEPPRSVVFIWDGSGSVAAHQPAIFQALNRFAEGLEPGRDVANMMALGSPLLIDGWAEYPAEVSHALASYDGRFSSSNAEPALQAATRALERRDGERIIFLMTDAQNMGRELSVWNDFDRVRPRIITLETHHGRRVETAANREYQNLMKSWARVAGGEYHYTTGRTDLIRAFEAAMNRLRQPTAFSLGAERSYREPPRPGSLRVIEGDTPVAAAGAVHLIFDASGSMLRRMEGGRRIDVAKRIVGEVLTARIPEQVPVALRAYGHTAPHSCESELLVAATAGNHGAVRNTVANIQAINLARTPLAASLDAVRQDLSDYDDQQRLVVMLTDGEESCEGDVGRAVADLIDDGLDIRLNIVGLHIEETDLQAEFERFAEQGGGEYFDSQDGEQLIEGLTRALAATFRVLDATGDEVLDGRVGDPAQELAPGDYELVVSTSEGEQRQAVRVAPQQSLEIRVDQ